MVNQINKMVLKNSLKEVLVENKELKEIFVEIILFEKKTEKKTIEIKSLIENIKSIQIKSETELRDKLFLLSYAKIITFPNKRLKINLTDDEKKEIISLKD